MRASSAKNKGMRLQQKVAEFLAVNFNLKIEARSCKAKPNTHALYVSENELPDLRIRPSGHAGTDVILVSDKAHKLLRFPSCQSFSIECKNVEAWSLGRDFWVGKLPALFLSAMRQASQHPGFPILFLSKNHWPIIVACKPFPGMLTFLRKSKRPVVLSAGLILFPISELPSLVSMGQKGGSSEAQEKSKRGYSGCTSGRGIGTRSS
jgi:hypothetical protein